MEKPVNLLWTSGWDSTYRLLSLVLIQQKTVQPFYVKDYLRASLEMEIKTMDKIKELVIKKAPHAKQLILPTIYKDRQEIGPNDVISARYKRLAATKPLGDQYEWLARYAEEDGVQDLELSIHQDDKARKFLEHYVVGEDEKENYRLKEEYADTDLALFKYFRFPILNLTKLDMEQTAVQHNFLDIMNQTWFCHYPKNGKPCGLCTPCASTIEEGLRRRLPISSQLRNFIHFTIKPPIRRLLKPSKNGLVMDAK
jgi:hypothetical protein